MSLADEVWRKIDRKFIKSGNPYSTDELFDDIRPLLDELERAREALEAAGFWRCAMSLADEVWNQIQKDGTFPGFIVVYKKRITPILDELERARRALEAADELRLYTRCQHRGIRACKPRHCDLCDAEREYDAARGKGEA